MATAAGNEPPGATALRTAAAGRRRGSRLGLMVQDPLALAGLLIIAVFGTVAVTAPVLAPYDPNAVAPAHRLSGPSATHLLGTDQLGRDLLSRLIYGSRWSLGASVVATALIMTIGLAAGATAGYLGGRIDQAIMRVVDLLLGFPSLILALAIAGSLGPGIVNVLLGLVVVWWADYARIVRGIVLSVREREFVDAARALGSSTPHVIRTHVLPMVVPPVAVLATVEMGSLILALSGLNFLGLGVQPPTAEWGAMINEGRRYLTTAPHLMMYPGLAITAVVMGFNLLGDGLRDVLDPQLRT